MAVVEDGRRSIMSPMGLGSCIHKVKVGMGSFMRVMTCK